MSEEKDIKKEVPAIRQIIIETNGNEIKIKKLEIAGSLELEAIFSGVLNYLKNLPKDNK